MVRVFLNSRSGSGVARRAKISSLIPTCQITPLADLDRLNRQDPESIPYIAAGGDGTVNAVANAVAGTARRMGVLPLGTLNHFARDIGLPVTLQAAAAVITAGHIRRFDAAQVNGRIFVNNSSLGAYPAMVLDRERMRKSGRSKWVALLAASARAFLRFRHLHVEMILDGQRRTCTTPFLFVGNNDYCLDVNLPFTSFGGRKRLTGGILALYLAPGATRAGVIRMAFAVLLRRLKHAPELQEFRVQEFIVHVHGRRRLRVSLDGEVLRMPGPLHYRTLPGALNVLAPE